MLRYSQLLIPTVKETPADAQVTSHRLMVRAGMIRKVAAGIYTYLPLGVRVLRKVEAIIREEMNRAGAQEIFMPTVQPAELWQESGRWQQYGPELLRLRDRKGGEFCLGPTHEEVVTSLIRDEVKSYRQLPLNVYQIQTKFRDEIRPRFGLMRGREFSMKDAYSFDRDDAGASRTYDGMFEAYCRVFARMGLTFRPVEADTGSIGGNRSHEFQVIADTGEDAIVHCAACHYAANVELAEIKSVAGASATATASSTLEKVATPGKKTIEEVAGFLGVPPSQVLKAVLFLVDDKPVMALCRGDHEVNEIKLKRSLGAKQARLLSDEEISDLVGAPAGYVGPVGIPKAGVRVVADHGVHGLGGLVTGANAHDSHFVQAMFGRDFEAELHDLRTASAGDACGRCGQELQGARGIEVGHVFFLGTKYSAAMRAHFLDEEGKERPAVMGCYGIGVGRTAAAAIEQNHDDDGIVWPMPIAPFQVAVLALGAEPEVSDTATQIAQQLSAAGIEVLLDDRDERPGVKFKDHDLIGVPVRVAVGSKGLKEGVVEVKRRSSGRGAAEKVASSEAVEYLASIVRELLQAAEQAAERAVEENRQ
ncbi:MAG: proline--tRNA ligase [Myxococcota bacterium]